MIFSVDFGQVDMRDIQDELARRGIYVEYIQTVPVPPAPTLPLRPPTAPADGDRVVVVAEPGLFPRPAYMPVYPPLPSPTDAERLPIRAGAPVEAREKAFPIALVVGGIALFAMVIMAERSPRAAPPPGSHADSG